MSRGENIDVNTRINGEQAKKELAELKESAKALRKQMTEALKLGDLKEADKWDRKLQDVNKRIQKAQKEAFNINEVMRRLDTATPNELRKTLRSINQQMNSGTIKRGTKEWNDYNEKAKQVRETLSAIKKEQRESESWLSRTGGKFKNFFSSILVKLGAITGATWGARESINTYLTIDESYSDVIKYAGKTKEEVKELNEEFKKIDTRTARTQLNKLAGDAGRLSLEAKEDLLDFVEAADVINLALGQDLGQEGITNIGKLAMMFGEDERLGLKQSMLSTGSAINELAQSSTASEPYLASFAARLGGTALQANMAQTEVLGFGSVLDQNMQQVEVSATVLQNVISKMFQTPKIFADISGKSVGEFTQLLKEDTNEALLVVLESLNKMGGMDKLAPLFDEMKLGGSRATGVLSTLAAKVDDIRVAQEIATKAYEEGTSVIDEANVKNNTAQAILEKKQQALKDEAEVLGEILFPIQTSGLDILSKTIKITTSVISFSVKHSRALITLAATIAAYNVATKLSVMWTERKNKATLAKIVTDKLDVFWTNAKRSATLLAVAAQEALTGSTTRARAAWKLFSKSLGLSPIGLAVSAVVALGGALYLLSTRTSKMEKATRSYFLEVEKEKTTLKELVEQFQKTKKGTLEYERAKKNLQNRYSETLTAINIEVESLYDNKKAYELLTAEIEKNTKAKVKNSYIEEYSDKSAKEIADQYTKIRKKVFSKLGKDKGQEAFLDIKELVDGSDLGTSYKVFEEKLNQYNLSWSGFSKNVNKILSSRYILQNQLQELDDLFGKLPQTTTPEDNPNIGNNTPDVGGGSGGGGKDDSKERLQKQLAEIEQWLAVARAQETFSYVQGEKNKEEYNQALEQLDMESLKKRMALYKEGTTEFAKLQEEYLLKTKTAEEKESVRSRESLQKELAAEKKALEQSFIDGEINLKTYKQKSFEMEVDHLGKMANAYDANSDERVKLEEQKEDLLLKDKLQKQEEFEKLKESLYKEYSQKSADELMNLEMQALESLHQEKLLSEEDFLKAQKALQEKYQTDNPSFLESERGKAMIEQTQFALSSMHTLMSAFDSYMQSSADAEIAKIDRKYEAEIRAAGNNQYQLRKIEERKQQEINKVNAKTADKALKFQLAMAISQALQGSINAYTSTAAIPIVGPAMAPIAAAVALAAGMMNVAAVKKQHAAAKQGFYKGGFTGPGRWDEEKGVVHSEEFVANRYAVRNPNVRPVLELINRAQKNNTIGSLTTADLMQHIGGSSTPSVANAPNETQPMDYSFIAAAMNENARVIAELKQRLDEPFVTVNTVDGDYGIKKALDAYNQQEKNKSRR